MSRTERPRTGIMLVALAMLTGLPLLGAALKGDALSVYAEFPPLTRYVAHAPFHWGAFALIAGMALLVVGPFEFRCFRSRRHVDATAPRRAFPGWGYLGLGLSGIAWILAWCPSETLTPAGRFTFTPLWCGYIVVVNALTYRQRGRCMLTHQAGLLLRLFVWSAVFWWFFEYLNRFVQNWYYVGIETFSPTAYAIFATLPFATVLPAVLGTYELLDALPRAGAGLDSFVRLNIGRPRLLASAVLLISAAGLAGIGIWPDYLYPLLWVAPLYILTSLEALTGHATIFRDVAEGRWRTLYLLAAAALICGGFWEMWNIASPAKWIYSVPFVHRFEIFEMPLLGFAGYLPFGIECAVIARWAGWRPDSGRSAEA